MQGSGFLRYCDVRWRILRYIQFIAMCCIYFTQLLHFQTLAPLALSRLHRSIEGFLGARFFVYAKVLIDYGSTALLCMYSCLLSISTAPLANNIPLPSSSCTSHILHTLASPPPRHPQLQYPCLLVCSGYSILVSS